MTRKSPGPRPDVLICCADCGQVTWRKLGSVFCFKCLERRKKANRKLLQIKRVAQDPDFYKKQNAYKLAWKRRQIIAKGPLHCIVCGVAIPRIRGRKESTAICKKDRILNRRWQNNFDRNMRQRALLPHPCNDCGQPVPRKRGRSAEKALCDVHLRARRRLYNRTHPHLRRAKQPVLVAVS